MASGIYAITNTINGHQYIGQTFSFAHRFATHRYELRRNHHHSPHLQHAWNRYGESSFTFTVLEIVEPCANLKEQLTSREQLYFDHRYEAKQSHEYNIAPAAGSQLGYRHTLETLQRMRAAAIRWGAGYITKGYTHTSDARAKMRAAKLGKPATDAQLKSLHLGRQTQRERGQSERQKAAFRAYNESRRGKPVGKAVGKPYSKERIAGLMALNAKRKAAAEAGEKVLTEQQIAANTARRGTTYSPERKAKQSEAIRKGWETRRARGVVVS